MGLRILLTGEPNVGKSTIIQHSINGVKHKAGFWTTELRRDDMRYGFMVQDARHHSVILSDTDRETPHKIGRYYVDVESFDTFLQKVANPNADDLIYIDEIGKMQLLSDNFKALLDAWMKLPNLMIGTIAKEDHEPYMTSVKNDDQTLLVEVGRENREQVLTFVRAVAANYGLVRRLNGSQYERFVTIVRSTSDLTLLYKLFHNTLVYVTGGAVLRLTEASFQVNGTTDKHHVQKHDDSFSCDCPLYDRQKACSHIFSVMLCQ